MQGLLNYTASFYANDEDNKKAIIFSSLEKECHVGFSLLSLPAIDCHYIGLLKKFCKLMMTFSKPEKKKLIDSLQKIVTALLKTTFLN